MAYLLTLGWPWLAGALALGALVGFLGFSRAKDVTFSGGWIVLLGLVALVIGFSGSIAEALSGRDAVLLDIALLAGHGLFQLLDLRFAQQGILLLGLQGQALAAELEFEVIL